MAEYCLTTNVSNTGGTIKQSGCSWAEKGLGESCAANHEEGTTLNIFAISADGYAVYQWSSSVAGVLPASNEGDGSITITMPSSDVDISVSFIHANVDLILQVDDGEGCISLITPSVVTDCSGGSISLPVGEVRVKASPDPGWSISGWKLDGSSFDGTDSEVDFNLSGYTQRIISVSFEESAPCSENELIVTIEGKGSVTPPSGPYCDNLTLSLNPIPSGGYFFKEWQYAIQSGIEEDGILLLVSMSSNRNITAIFEPISGYEAPVSTVFYCPSEISQNSVVSFDFTNNWENPSQFDTFHFRVNFYADADRTKLVYSAFSFSDTKRWFYNDTYFSPILSGGVEIEMGSTLNIVYDPEILPSNSMETQRAKTINSDGVYEKPLVCGVKYYVDAQVYNNVEGSISFIETIILILSCDDIDSYLWNYNKDDNNWLCSGQGKSDLQITDTSAQSIFSGISSNIFGMFEMVWQSRRENVNAIYVATWDSNKDILYSSGQGMHDKLRIDDGDNPIILTDQTGNFFITANTRSSFKIYACPFPVALTDAPTEEVDSSFGKFCYPGLTTILGVSYDSVSMRVYSEDIDSSLTINKDKAVPVVNKQLVRLDVEGISGAYAVRLRNINDDAWGGWINIGSNLYESAVDNINRSAEDVLYDAYRIDNDRFIVPWGINKVNGLRRICCQVLTLYGITRTFCLDIFVNFDAVQHIFKFYFKKTGDGVSAVFEDGDEFPTYEGQHVLSLKDDAGSLVSDTSSTIYFTTTFAEDVSYGDNSIQFNVIQQGVNDIWGQLLRKIDSRTFYGEFPIYAEDKIFNKDGKAFIELILPDSGQATGCLQDTLDGTSDPYNLMVSDDGVLQNKDLTPEEAYERRKMNTISKVQNIDKFKQYYDQDDSNFKFGDPLYFRDK